MENGEWRVESGKDKKTGSGHFPVSKFYLSLLVLVLSTFHFPLSTFPLPAAYASDISVTARVDKHLLSLDDTLTLTVVVEGETRSLPAPEIPAITGFRTYSSSRSQNISIVNGEIFAAITFRYILVPQSAGKFTIPSIQIAHRGKIYETNPIEVEVTQAAPTTPSFPSTAPTPRVQPQAPVTKPPPPGVTKKLFIQTYVDKLRPYVNEQVTLTFAFYRAVDLFENPEYSPPETIGFWSEDMPPQTQYFKTIDGRTYHVTEIKTAIFPTQPGELTIGPARLKVTLREEPEDLFSQDPFDIFRQDPFSVFGRGKAVTLATQPITLSAQPLPEKDQPENFKGDVGEYRLSVKVEKTQSIEVNQPITLTLEVSGKGNIKTITAPTVLLPQGFKEYEGGGSEDINKEDYTVQGKKVFEKILVPTIPGRYEISPIRYLYFSPREQQYRIAKSDPIRIEVKPSSKEPEAVIGVTAGVPAAGQIRQIGQDIRFIKTQVSDLKDQTATPLDHPYFWWIHTSPWLILGLLYSWQRRRERLSQDVLYARQQKAHGLARKRLHLAQGKLHKKDLVGFYTEVQKAILSFLSDRLGIPTASLTLDETLSQLRVRGVTEETLNQLRTLLEECDMARFAPGQFKAEEMGNRLSQAESLIVQLDRARKTKAGSFTNLAGILFLTSSFQLLASSSNGIAATPAEIFLEANAAYETQKYDEAIQGYRQLLQMGIRHGAVYYNLGNAYWKKGERGNAILSYERARRLEPRDSDIRANLELTQGQVTLESKLKTQAQPDRDILERLAEFLTGRLSLRELFSWNLVCYWFFIGVALVWTLWVSRRAVLKSWTVTALVLFVLSSGLSVLKCYDLNQPDAIVLEKESILRSGPGEDFPSQAALPEGTKIRIERQTRGWVEARIGILQGWLPLETVERI